MAEDASRIATNLACVRGKIAEAARRSNRSAEDVQLVAVTKYVDIAMAEALVAAGCTTLGESRPQELCSKAERMNHPTIQWHLIGHLQRNKVKKLLHFASAVHSIDSLRLLETIRQHARPDHVVRILLEVNISGDQGKQGFVPQQMPEIVRQIEPSSSLAVVGLMTMAGRTSGPEKARREFAKLRELREQLRPMCATGVRLDELSMGMSGDFEVAIEEGATMVRVGTALFEGISR